MRIKNILRRKTLLLSFMIALLSGLFFSGCAADAQQASISAQGELIKWVDFDIPADILMEAMELDIETHNSEDCAKISWIELLAYLAAKYGGDFSHYSFSDMSALLERVSAGESISQLGEELTSFSYYREAYTAVLGGILGVYERETESGWEPFYGLKAFSPIAASFPYSEYDDFGVGRSYGFARRHLGHDMMAAVGTPVIAVESGVVEAMGWNQYGGWRIGIRSFDGLRYHYYAHLRKDSPFAQGIEVGQIVMAGDVIGYVGRTGYSLNENVNNIETNHLHYGLQLVFDESQKETVSEIWVDVYDICQLLRLNCSTVQRGENGEWHRAVGFRENIPEDRFEIPVS